MGRERAKQIVDGHIVLESSQPKDTIRLADAEALVNV